MKNLEKTLLLLCLCVLLFCLTAGAPAYAAEPVHTGTIESDNLAWTLMDDGELIFEPLAAGEATVPDMGKNKEGEWLAYKAQIVTATIDEGITGIGGSAFSGCTALTHVDIPDTVTSIGGGAFSGCTALTRLDIPDSVTEMGQLVFSGTTLRVHVPTPTGNAAKTVSNTLYSQHDYYVVDDDYFALRCSNDGVVTLSAYTGSDEDVVLPEYVSILNERAFQDNTTIRHVTLTGVTQMGRNVFSGCTALETATLNEGVTAIYTQDFYGCTGLRSVIVPNSVTSIMDSAFDGANDVCLSVGCASYAREWAVGRGYTEVADGLPDSGRRYLPVHVPEEIPAVAPTCTATGLTAGSRCSVCDLILAEQKTVAALGHNWDTPTYVWNGDHSELTATHVCKRDNSHSETETVNASSAVTLAPLCEAMGQTTYTSAAFTNPAFTAQTVTLTDVSALGHDWDEPTYVWNDDHSAVTATRVCGRDGSHTQSETVSAAAEISQPATCTEQGKTTYTSAAFTNAAFAPQSVTLTNVAPLGHSWGEPVYTWNRTHTRLTARHICTRDASHAESETVTVSAAVTRPATCTEQGKTTCTSAAFMNGAFAAQSVELTIIPALGHDWLDETYTWNADHTQLTARHVCARDAAHAEEETVGVTSRIAVAAGCLTSGKTAYLSDAFENPYFESQSVTLSNIPALGHAWGEPGYLWNDDHSELTATRVCAHDARHTETETVPAAAEIVSPASCETEGRTAYFSESFENPAFEAQTVTLTDIPALGHDWQNPVYTWSADRTRLTAKRVCRHDTGHAETETVGVTAQITREPSCTLPGQTTYTSAAFTNPAFHAKSLTQSNLPALGHDWQPETYTWADDFSQLTAARVCRHDASHTESETVAVSAEVTRPASCTVRGRTTYASAAFSNPAFSVHTITLANIPKLDHSWTQTPSIAAAEGADGVRGSSSCSVCGAVQHETVAVSAQSVLRIPAVMEEIGEEAFMGVDAQQITLPSGLRAIGSRAFAGCGSLLIAVIPASVDSIADDAFDGSDVAVICPDGCYAAEWCDGHHIPHNP